MVKTLYVHRPNNDGSNLKRNEYFSKRSQSSKQERDKVLGNKTHFRVNSCLQIRMFEFVFARASHQCVKITAPRWKQFPKKQFDISMFQTRCFGQNSANRYIQPVEILDLKRRCHASNHTKWIYRRGCWSNKDVHTHTIGIRWHRNQSKKRSF